MRSIVVDEEAGKYLVKTENEKGIFSKPCRNLEATQNMGENRDDIKKIIEDFNQLTSAQLGTIEDLRNWNSALREENKKLFEWNSTLGKRLNDLIKSGTTLINRMSGLKDELNTSRQSEAELIIKLNASKEREAELEKCVESLRKELSQANNRHQNTTLAGAISGNLDFQSMPDDEFVAMLKNAIEKSTSNTTTDHTANGNVLFDNKFLKNVNLDGHRSHSLFVEKQQQTRVTQADAIKNMSDEDFLATFNPLLGMGS